MNKNSANAAEQTRVLRAQLRRLRETNDELTMILEAVLNNWVGGLNAKAHAQTVKSARYAVEKNRPQ